MTTTSTTPTPCSTIHAALCACMADVEAIGKNRKNLEQKYSYRGIDDIYNSLHPIFARHGVFVTCETIDIQRTERTTQKGSLLQVVYGRYRVTFHAEDGTSVSLETCAEAMDSGDKATNKASSAALKYALMQTLLIPTEEVKDSEADTFQLVASPPAATDAEVARCVQAIREKRNRSPFSALQDKRTLTTDQLTELYLVLQELEQEDQDRPTLRAQAPAQRASRDAF